MDDNNTPIEEYSINGHDLFVKRDDLFLASHQPMVPALAKLRGTRVVLQRMKEEDVKKVAVFDARVSKSGQGVAFLCQELGLHCAVGFPKLKAQTELNESQKKAHEMGAEVWAVQAGRTAPCYAAFKREAQLRGYTVLPLGLTFFETAREVAKIAEAEAERFETIVVSTGTGTVACGIALGARKAKVIGVSCGMSVERQKKRVMTICNEVRFDNPWNLELVPTDYDYYQALDTSSCPFPTSPFYDMKAYVWLLKNFDTLKQPVLFYNIGV